jgi:CBS domain-containing protein
LGALLENRALVTGNWGTPLTDAAHTLADRRIGCLPLTTADHPEGVVTRTDLSRALLASATLAARAAS